MVFKVRLFKLTLAAVTLLSCTQCLLATTDSITFGTFTQTTPNQTALFFTNNGLSGANASASFTGTAVPIQFTIDSDAPTTAAGTGLAGQTINAVLTMTSATQDGVDVAGHSFDQPITGGTTIRIQSLADYQSHNNRDLLYAYYAIGDMVGATSQRSATEYNATDVLYSSYYLNMSGAAHGSISLGFKMSHPYTINANGLLDSFTASGGIGSMPAEFTPEPQTYLLISTGLSTLIWKVRRRLSATNRV